MIVYTQLRKENEFKIFNFAKRIGVRMRSGLQKV